MTTTYRADTDIPAFVTGQILPRNSRACRNREAALLSLCHLKPEYLDCLLVLSPGEWRKLLHWLDVSGLSLYFIHRVNELDLQDSLPIAVNQRLQQNLSDNRTRIRGLLQESRELQTEFQRADVSYALLKGFSLCPLSVPMVELRHQLDLDFLVDESGASKAREILERAGYRLHAVSGKTWEYKKNETLRFSTKDMFKDGFGHMVDLHVESTQRAGKSLLRNLEHRSIEGITMPVLPSSELLLLQGRQVLKDLCSPFLRASHLVELYRHMCVRRDDTAFWSEVRALAEEDPRSIVGLGVASQLIESVMEGAIPSQLAIWTMCRLPAGVQRWLGLYGTGSVYGMPPGTKFYLLLRRELAGPGSYPSRALKRDLLPTRLPPMMTSERADETLTFRLRRYALQLRFILFRLRFHAVEGVRYAWASYRWRKYRNEFSA
jgi:hypothetical protein